MIKNASIVDTPGLNALDAFHEEVARGFIDEADAIVWVFSATRGGAASELGMLQELREVPARARRPQQGRHAGAARARRADELSAR